MTTEHEVGQSLTLTARFHDVDGNPADPDSVRFYVVRPGDEYEPGEEYERQALDGVTHDDTGLFSAPFTPDQPGCWWWAAVATGSVEAASETQILVRYPHAH